MRFEYYRDRKQEWRWRLVARNGRTVADSGEGYTRITSCREAMLRFKSAIEDADELEITEEPANG